MACAPEMMLPRPLLWSRRRKWIVATLASLCILGLVLGLPIGFTQPGKTHSDSNGNDDGYTGDGYAGSLQWPNPEPITGVIPHNHHYVTLDPALIRRASDGRFFLLTTRGNNRGATWAADSLSGPWSFLGDTLREQGGAPDVRRLNDTHYLMLHNQHFPYDTIGVSHPEATVPWHDASIVVQTSRSLEPGSWVRGGRLEIPWAARYNILDAALLTLDSSLSSTSPAAATDGSGNSGQEKPRHLLTFGSYQEGLFQVPLADPPLQLAPNAMQHMTHLERNATAVSPRGQTEAPYLFGPHKGWRTFPPTNDAPGQNMLWMRYEDAYRVAVCRSRGPRGGFTDRQGRDCLTESGGSVVLASHDAVFAPGGQGVLDDPEAGLVLYYHYVHYDPALGAVDPARPGFFFGWNKLRFDQQDWPYVDGK